MLDFLGQVLNIEDYVVGINFYSTKSCLFLGKIKDFVGKMVAIEIIKDDTNYEKNSYKIVPDKLVKIDYKEINNG